MALNKVIVNGRLTVHPELKQTQSGVPVCTFGLAIQRDKDHTEFFDCVAWKNTAEFVSKYFAKGDGILIDGHIGTSEWTTQDGSKRKAVKIVADSVSFADAKKPAEPKAESASADVDCSMDDDLPF